MSNDIADNYCINPHIKVYGVATQELATTAFEYWEKTCKHYGYQYEVLGRDSRWIGFGLKIKLFCRALKQCSTEYAVIMDTTDTFMCGPADELYEKLQKLDNCLVISGEMKPWCPHPKNKLKDLEHY